MGQYQMVEHMCNYRSTGKDKKKHNESEKIFWIIMDYTKLNFKSQSAKPRSSTTINTKYKYIQTNRKRKYKNKQPWHIVVTLLEIKDKEVILKAAKDNWHISYRRKMI